MSPKKIVAKSRAIGLDIIAICDHNTTENTAAVIRAGNKHGLLVIPGMEICSKEEVHVLTLFESLAHTLEMQHFIYAKLPGENQPKIFGYQVIANEYDEVLGENPKLLIGATQLGLPEIVAKAHSLGGLCISSHVDRPTFGIIGQLGFIPNDLKLDAIEVSGRTTVKDAKRTIPGIRDLPIITASDAHALDDIGKVRTEFLLAAPELAEIRLALQDKSRYICCHR
jgi:PHP family Zn ribbon phosphoesterase